MENGFLALVIKSEKNNWCTKVFCTTCGCQFFRAEMQKLGFDYLISELYLLSINDIENSKVRECIDVFLSVYNDKISMIKGNKLPKILQEAMLLDKSEYALKNIEYLRKYLVYIELRKQALQRKENKIIVYQAYKKSSIIKRNDMVKRLGLLKDIDKLYLLSIEGLKPNYYPINLSEITDVDLLQLGNEKLYALIYCFANYRKREWVAFCNRLMKFKDNILQ